MAEELATIQYARCPQCKSQGCYVIGPGTTTIPAAPGISRAAPTSRLSCRVCLFQWEEAHVQLVHRGPDGWPFMRVILAELPELEGRISCCLDGEGQLDCKYHGHLDA